MEYFKQIEGIEGYSVSNLGRVRNDLTDKIVEQTVSNGYLTVNIRSIYGVLVANVHRIVGLTFIPNPENKKIVDHIDGNNKNNNLNNLRWATHSENAKNRKVDKRNKSGHTGIYKLKNGLYLAKLSKKNLGYVETLEEAIELREEAIKKDPEWSKMKRKIWVLKDELKEMKDELEELELEFSKFL